MKKSQFVQLVLLSSLAASCSQKPPMNEAQRRLHMRTDSTGQYTRGSGYHGGYYHFYPFGMIGAMSGNYQRGGYGSGTLSARSSAESKAVARGGFGRSGYHVSS